MSEEHRQPPPIPPHGPPPISYASAVPYSAPLPPIPAGITVFRFLIGLIGGGILSAIVHFGGWNFMTEHHIDWIILLVPAVKLLLGIVFLCVRGWRSLGAEILVSIALGVMIFMGACMANIDWGKMH